VRAVIEAERVPVMAAAWEYAAAGAIPGGTKNNLDYVKDFVQWNETTPDLLKFILADAQTSGGLLISLPEGQAIELVARLHESGNQNASIIGLISSGDPGIIV
jgi:selenide,water dikinase